MANVQTKIEKWGLAPKVLELLKQGITSPSSIAEALNEFMLGRDEHKGRSVTRTAVTRFIEAKKPEIKKAATEIFTEHVNAVVPADLKALEEIEASCLAMFRETVENRHARLAEAAVKIKNEAARWRAMLEAAKDPKTEDDAVRTIIARCLKIVAGDDDEQKRKLAAGKLISQIIDLKLTKAAMLEDDGKGRIFILDSKSDEARSLMDENGGERKVFTMLTGGRNG